MARGVYHAAPLAHGMAQGDIFRAVPLPGQGVAGQLMEAAVEKLRADNMEVRPICSYAKTWFEKHPEEADLLKK